MATSNVQCTSDFIRVCGRDECVCDVGYECEIARLRAVADNREGFSVCQLGQEYTKHGAVCSGCTRARTVDIKKAQREGGKPIHLGPMQYEFFAHVFGERVGVTRPDRCGFGSWIHIRYAVT